MAAAPAGGAALHAQWELSAAVFYRGPAFERAEAGCPPRFPGTAWHLQLSGEVGTAHCL